MQSSFLRALHRAGFIFILLAALTPGATYAQRSERPDAIVLRGAEVEVLLGSEVDSLNVFSVGEKGELRQIPFQVDEKFPGGEYVLIPNRLPETGRLTPEDELVFMARDAGRRLGPEAQVSNVRVLEEIELSDSVTGTRSYVYAASEIIPQVASSLNYVTFDAGERNILGESYFLTLPPLDSAQLQPWQKMGLSLAVKAANPNPAHASRYAGNQLKREWIEASLESLGGAFSWEMDQDDFDATSAGERSGPIRTIRKLRLRPKLGYGIRMSPITVIQTYYDRYMTTEVRGEGSALGKGLLTKIDITFGEEFVAGGAGPESLLLHNLSAAPEVADAVHAESGGEACPLCLVWKVDGKKIPNGPFAFELLRYFPKDLKAENAPFTSNFYERPLTVRTRVFSEHLVYRGPLMR